VNSARTCSSASFTEQSYTSVRIFGDLITGFSVGMFYYSTVFAAGWILVRPRLRETQM
jgi:hypothetical protein